VDHISTEDIKTIVSQSLSDREGDFIMTLAEKLKKEGFEKGVEQGMQQGILKGLLEGIEMAVILKFPEDAYRIMPLIYQLNTVDQLKKVKDAIMTVRNASELMTMMNGL
jgi:predicted transposase YdaD